MLYIENVPQFYCASYSAPLMNIQDFAWIKEHANKVWADLPVYWAVMYTAVTKSDFGNILAFLLSYCILYV